MINAVDIEAIESLNNLVDAIVTERRLEWAADNLVREQLLPLEMPSMGQLRAELARRRVWARASTWRSTRS